MSHPDFQAQNPRFSKDKFGWFACGPFSLAMGIQATTGVKHRGKDVRLKTHDSVPEDGTNLDQLARAAQAFGTTLRVRRRMDWDDLMDTVDDGHPIVLGLSYEPIHKTDVSGDVNFTDNHYVMIVRGEDGTRVFDPLCDGRPTARHLGSYPIDEELVARSAGRMVLDTIGTVVGHGRAYVGILPRPKNAVHPSPDPHDVPTDPARPVVFRHGGEPRARGEYICIRDVANVRANPHVTHLGAPAQNVVGHLRRGDSFRCAQTTDIGQDVAGSRRWYGDRPGARWVHSSRVEHV